MEGMKADNIEVEEGGGASKSWLLPSSKVESEGPGSTGNKWEFK